MKIPFAILLLLSLLQGARVAAIEPVPLTRVEVKNHRPIKPGEHPRLLFRKQDVPELRRRAGTPEGKIFVRRLKEMLGGGEGMPEHYSTLKRGYGGTVSLPEGAYTISHAAGFGMLYQLTGEQRYADLAQECIEVGFKMVRDRDGSGRYSMVRADGQLRIGPSLGWTALAYDLCYEAWTPEFRKKLAHYIVTYDEKLYPLPDATPSEIKALRKGKNSFVDMVKKPKHGRHSNHYGAITGGVGLALLALENDPEVAGYPVSEWIDMNEKKAADALAGFGPRGFFAEGQGPSHVAANPAMLTYFQALRNVKGRDYISSNENLQWVTMRWVGATSIDGKGNPVYLVRHELFGQGYGGDIVTPGSSLSNSGRFVVGFGAIPKKYHPYALWSFENYFKQADQNRLNTINYPHHAILGLVNWPIGVKPKHPSEIIPTSYRDEHYGHYVLRSGWSGTSDDVLVTLYTAKQGQPGKTPWPSLPLKVRGLGRKHEIGLWSKKGPIETHFFHENQSTSVRFDDGSLIGTDFSGRSGAAGVVVIRSGKKTNPRMNSGYFAEFLHQEANGLKVFTVNKDKMHPKLVADGDGVRLGGLRIAVDGNQLKFMAASGDTGKVDSFAARGIDPKIDAVTDETVKHPGRPDALMSFDYTDYEQRGDEGYFREAFGRSKDAFAFNIRPEHLRPGMYGQAYPFRPSGVMESVLADASNMAKEGELKHPLGYTGVMTTVRLPNESLWHVGPQSTTITFWLKFNQPRSGHALLVEPYAMGNFHMGFHPGPTAMIAGAHGQLNVPYPNTEGEWNMLTLVKDVERGLLTYYVNGEFAGRAKARVGGKGKSGPVSAGSMLLGGRIKGGERYAQHIVEGDMDEFAIYKRRLTAGEVMALYQAGIAGQKALSERKSEQTGIAAYMDADVSIGAAPLRVQFDAARSVGQGGTTGKHFTYTWNFGDGRTGTGTKVNHTFTADGEYTVTLVAKASDGSTSTASRVITVQDRPPVARITEISASANGVVLSAKDSYDPDQTPLQYAWSAIGKTSTGKDLTLSNVPAGTHEIVLRVMDGGGLHNSVRYTLSVLDAQGYRLPENPGKVVPGVHYQLWEMFAESKDILSPRAPKSKTNQYDFKSDGQINDLSWNSIAQSRPKHFVVYAGYLAIPRDGEYTLFLDGLKSTRIQIGEKISYTNRARFHVSRPGRTVVKLRKGLHRFSFFHPAMYLSKGTPWGDNVFYSRIMLQHEDGTRFVVGPEHVFRSQLDARNPGSDRLSLGGPIAQGGTLAAGNTAPKLRVQSEVLSRMDGAQTVRFTAQVSDAEGDAVRLNWHLPNGETFPEGASSYTRILTAGPHTVMVEADDGRGGFIRETLQIRVPGSSARSISIDFEKDSARDGLFHSTYPGERCGLVPSTSWNQLAYRNPGRGKTPGVIYPKHGLSTDPDARSMQYLWLDNEGHPVDLVVTLPKGANQQNFYREQGIPRRSPIERLMNIGLETEQLMIKGVPYKTYDVIVYVLGDVTKQTPADAWWVHKGADLSKTAKKRRKKANPPSNTVVVKANGVSATFAPLARTHRWNGHLQEITDKHPNGNVIILRNVTGSELNMTLKGAFYAGIQLVEK